MAHKTRNAPEAILAVLIMVFSSFAGFVAVTPAVGAANGDGNILEYSPTVITEGTSKEIVLLIHNDNPQNAANPICLDEIIVTAPANWSGTAVLEEATNLGDVIWSNEADDGSYSGLVSDLQSIRIVPDMSSDGVMLCPSGTVKIRISGLVAPDSPAGGEDADFLVLTSDQQHNEPSNSNVRMPIDKDASCGAKPNAICSFSVKVTEASGLKIEYLQFVNISVNFGNAEYQIEAKAWGAWGRLTEIYVNSSAAMTVDVYVEKSGAGFQTTDYLVADNIVLSQGFNTIPLTLYSGVDKINQMDEGFVKDSEQGGSNVLYYINFVSGSGALSFLGHADEAADESIDPTYMDTGFQSPPKEGTIIGVEQTVVPPYGFMVERALKVQLVRNFSGKLVDVKEDGLPVLFNATLGALDELSEITDAKGEVENHLLAGNKSGNSLVEICLGDPIACVYEDVGINSGAPDHFNITEGYTSTGIGSGTYQKIEVTVYDQFGNVITDNPSKVRVNFTIVSEPDMAGLNDASLDDDTVPGPVSKKEDEQTLMGIADIFLLTSQVAGDHTVEVCAEGLGCKNATLHGLMWQADSVKCMPIGVNSSEVTADQCFDVLVQVVDKNGNPLAKWESIVGVSLESLDESPEGSKYIFDTDMREETPKLPNGMPTYVKGKLNNANSQTPYAWAIVTICGCEALGQFEVVCKSDTLKEGRERLDVINSQPDCIDLDIEGREGECDNNMSVHTSIVDTCGNKVVDQECTEGGWATSCVKLEASCGTLSTNKTCVDLRNTGQAPLVGLDISGCECGDIEVTAIDETDCCPSVYQGQLPMCSDVSVSKIGPADNVGMDIYPFAQNQNNFWVSEKTVLELTLLDECGQVAVCEGNSVDVELSGEDCSNDTIQVDSPITLTGTEICDLNITPVHKVVIENCAVANKTSGGKEWVDLPEKDDLVVDKIAFGYSGPTTAVQACIYEETELTEGFQPFEDRLWKCIELDTVPSVPLNDADSGGNEGAWDSIHDLDGVRNGVGDVYLIELDDRISKYNGMNEYDNQRLGGAVIEPGSSKDFYIVLSGTGPCGTYDADYIYYEDYNSPDIISWTPDNKYYTHVIDTLEGSEEYTRRNDDYTGFDPYPNTSPATPSYGFGDRILHNLTFDNGSAKVYFRALVSEQVNVFVNSTMPVVLMQGSLPVNEDNQASIAFIGQPATQVVARNHGDSGSPDICDDAGFEPSSEYDPDSVDEENHQADNLLRDCRPAMACGEEGYDINLQVADGFQNQIGLSTDVQLHSCLTFPHYIYLGDTLLPFEENITVDLWDYLGLHDISSEPWDACFDMAKFKMAVREILKEKVGDDAFIASFMDSDEFSDMMNRIFADKQVTFVEVAGYPLSTDSAGNLVVTTDSSGKARVRVESNSSSMFDVKSFDASFRLFFVPHALDADYLDVAFSPGEASQWVVEAIPSEGIPADGEQEAKILIRKTDACGNPIAVTEEVNVTVASSSGRAIISRDFSFKNNYDNTVSGTTAQWNCKFLLPWFDDCSLQVMDDVIENVTVTLSDANCESSANGTFCGGFPGCSEFDTEIECVLNECLWFTEQECQAPASTTVKFVGAPVKLTITEITHSDLIPADGWKFPKNFDLPSNACTDEQIRECELDWGKELCFKRCVEYGNTGAWVTVEVQDKFGERVTGYLGDGLKKDPGDVSGKQDNVFEKICVALDDPRAYISDSTFGWLGLSLESIGKKGRVYCGDLAYGKGSLKVVYSMLDHSGQPLSPEETRKVVVSVFDVCDRELFEYYGGNWKEERWDDLCNGQEYNENNLPDSETASRLNPDSNKIIFTSVPDRWDISADKTIVSADGSDFAVLTINTENKYMDVRASVDATVQSSLLGSRIESEAINPDCYVEGIYDPLNPTSINVLTEDCSGGNAELRIYSTQPGKARVTVTGNSFGCKKYMNGFEYIDYFERMFSPLGFESVDDTNISSYTDFNQWWSFCEQEQCMGELELPYEYYVEYAYIYWVAVHTQGINAQMQFYTPMCMEWGVIPLTPKSVEIDFQQAFQDTITLEAGWNFFSVPNELDPSNDEWGEIGLDSACTASAMWDDSAQAWVASVPASTVLTPLEGYWCFSPGAESINVKPMDTTGVYLPPTKQVFSGWNDVGLNNRVETKMEYALISIDQAYRLVLDWVEALQRYVPYANNGESGGGSSPGTTGMKNMESGQAYFIWVTSAAELAGLS